MTLGLSTPFAPTGIWMVGPRGEYRARSDRYRLDVLGPDGSVRRIEADPEPVPVTDAEREYRVDRTTSGARSIDPSWSWNLPAVPETKPFLKSIYTGAEGRIWLQVSTPGEPYEAETDDGVETRWREPTLFDVFEPDGTYLGSVEPPPDHSFGAYRGDTVWALYRDELDVQYLKRFRVVFPELPGGD
jgi:hypothetical protein